MQGKWIREREAIRGDDSCMREEKGKMGEAALQWRKSSRHVGSGPQGIIC